jgi:UDP-2-acetamido-3-amino-2,3-dideoxy-glucuronate N-acetyltransferase
MNSRNLALIGAGYWGKNLARNFHALGALHTLCDLSPAILDTYGADYAGVEKTGSLESIWSNPSITQVAIAAPAVHHHKLAKAAILAGKDVYVEKPLCLKIEDAEELTVLARQHGRILMVGHLLQYHAHVCQLQAWVASGAFGTVQYITSNRLSLGKFRREENVLWSFAPHDLSVILSLAGNQLPEKIACTGSGYLTPGVEDVVVVNLAFAGGLRAHVYASWVSPFKEQKLTIVGSKALAVFDDTKPWAEKLALYRDYVEETPAGPVPRKAAAEFAVLPEAEPLRTECEHFLDCCRSRQAPRTDGAEGSRVLRVLQAAQSSLSNAGATISL